MSKLIELEERLNNLEAVNDELSKKVEILSEDLGVDVDFEIAVKKKKQNGRKQKVL